MLSFAGCPSAVVLGQRLDTLAKELGFVWTAREVSSPEEGELLGFAGSPTLLIDGIDPFTDPSGNAGWACRLYATPEGASGCPAIDQLRDALTSPHGGRE